jgi:hypothetical protein
VHGVRSPNKICVLNVVHMGLTNAMELVIERLNIAGRRSSTFCIGDAERSQKLRELFTVPAYDPPDRERRAGPTRP